jgi:hypothetical protein
MDGQSERGEKRRMGWWVRRRLEGINGHEKNERVCPVKGTIR